MAPDPAPPDPTDPAPQATAPPGLSPPDPAPHDRIPEAALDWHLAGRGAVLATLISAWGSAPRRPGAQMAVSGDGGVAGSVSGGCVESDVILAAARALRDGRPRLLDYGVADAAALAAGLACGGRIRVLVEPVGPEPGLPPALLADLVAARAARRPVALEVDVGRWTRRLSAFEMGADPAGPNTALDTALDGETFRVLHLPPLRLVVVGAGHIAQPLLAMARHLGLQSVLVDPRSALATPARFPGETILDLWPDEALARLAPDARTAIVTLTHDDKLDDPALIAALASPAFHVGCLGSRRTHAARRARLAAAGVAAAALDRLHGPVGLDIGAATPAEIALSVLAQIVLCHRGANRGGAAAGPGGRG